MKYKAYSIASLKNLPIIKKYLSIEKIKEIEIVGKVFPFKVNNYVIEELIDWENYESDPIFKLTFPQKEMLFEEDYEKLLYYHNKNDLESLKQIIKNIRNKMNPHPAGQKDNIVKYNDIKLEGLQHKYKETVLFFPKEGQTCHAYCTFCFRWPQFVNEIDKFSMDNINLVIEYIKHHPEITDLLITGGDPMIMKAKFWKKYINAILDAKIPHLKHIRIGSKVLTYWPYRFVSDDDSKEILELFQKITDAGIHLSFMAHFNHYQELKTDIVEEAIHRILSTGAIIRTQAPVIKGINDSSDIWVKLWKKQVSLNMIPYYMFIERDTGAQHYFSIPLEKAWRIFNNAFKQVSGLIRTVKGPSMSTYLGKIRILGITELLGKKYFILDLLQCRKPDFVGKPFLAEYNPYAYWVNHLEPASIDKFSQEVFKHIKEKNYDYYQAINL